MSKVWALHKARVLGLVALALLSGYSLTGWLYFQFERNSSLSLGPTALTLGVLGFMLAAVLFFVTATFLVTLDGEKVADDNGNDFLEDRFSDRHELTADPVYNAVMWGNLSLTPTDDSNI